MLVDDDDRGAIVARHEAILLARQNDAITTDDD
jgi:hypothetical protein